MPKAISSRKRKAGEHAALQPFSSGAAQPIWPRTFEKCGARRNDRQIARWFSNGARLLHKRSSGFYIRGRVLQTFDRLLNDAALAR
jgi:hypothetical protein